MDLTELVIDISSYDEILKPQELIDGGVRAVILKTGSGMRRDPKFEQNGTICAKAGLILLGYHWDDIIYDPNAQAQFAVEDIVKTGLPVKMLFADQEQWWSSWEAWYHARAGTLPWSEVPFAPQKNISIHNQVYMKKLASLTPKMGVYTNYGFVTSWARPISTWIGEYTVWVAHYGRQIKKAASMTWKDLKDNWLPDYQALIPPGVKVEKIVGHQFTGDRCMLPGVYTQYGRTMPLDVSVFNKDFLDGLAAAPQITIEKKIEEPSPTVPKDATASKYFVNVGGLNVRKGAGVENEIIGLLKNKEQVEVVSKSGNWAKLKSGGWVYLPYLSPVA